MLAINKDLRHTLPAIRPLRHCHPCVIIAVNAIFLELYPLAFQQR
ncbi:glutaredoxin [Synechocystis sp. PCC 6714]|nr:glutaredoxin [Synechocystis sp. PCC 6714]